jgi:hypothetical protein
MEKNWSQGLTNLNENEQLDEKYSFTLENREYLD